MRHGPRPAPGGRDPLAVDRAALGRRARCRRSPNRGNSLVPLAVVALGLLLYIYFHPGVRSLRAGRPDAAAEAGSTTMSSEGPGADVVELAPAAGISRRRLKKSRHEGPPV